MNIKELTSHESILIQAPTLTVWEILTKISYMKQWSELLITFTEEQELHKGSKIHWVNDKGESYCIGTVTDFEPEKKLRVSPQFASWKDSVSPDVIASVFTLHKQGNNTHLEFSYGDFVKVPDGLQLWEMYLDSIDPTNKELGKIKQLAEDKTNNKVTQSQDKIIKCYDDTAESYAAERIDELSKKPLDRLLLKEFASINKDKGACVDFGCGPGQTTKFLYEHGVTDITGVDLSPGMIDTARRLFPKIKFNAGDLLKVSYPSNYFGSTLAFYAIVHFTYEQVKITFSEVNRVLKKGGQFLFSFHVGNETVHYDKVGDVDVDIDLFFFQTQHLIKLLHETGFGIIDALERFPYEEVEYASKRGYIWAEKK
ncbi:MAG: methyltransferase domain-containing protein [Chryseolinea sp.]